MKASTRLFVQDRFYSNHRVLRSYFDRVQGDPRGSDPRRFCWDFWHVPDQYQLLRTPAYHYFPKSIYAPFHQRLVHWGREMLGCHDVSPPWMSAYIEGCRQELHADLPHGPWAFVYSLSPSKTFKGGETLLLREEILSFWENSRVSNQDNRASQGLELNQVVERIEPIQNRLVVFDPRIPHGVSRVSGARDLLEARLVIHGWFVAPRPFIDCTRGDLSERELSLKLDGLLEQLNRFFMLPENRGLQVQGMASFGFRIQGGKPTRLKLLVHSLRSSLQAPNSALLELIFSQLSLWRFKQKADGVRVTLPIVFD